MKNEKLFIPNLIQFLYFDRCIGLRLILLRNVILQRYYYDITIRSFSFVNVHLIASNKGESANQKAAYKIIVFELTYRSLSSSPSPIPAGVPTDRAGSPGKPTARWNITPS